MNPSENGFLLKGYAPGGAGKTTILTLFLAYMVSQATLIQSFLPEQMLYFRQTSFNEKYYRAGLSFFLFRLCRCALYFSTDYAPLQLQVRHSGILLLTAGTNLILSHPFSNSELSSSLIAFKGAYWARLDRKPPPSTL